MNELIDYTLLKPIATQDDIIRLCEEAANSKFFSVCVQPCNVILAKNSLEDTDVKVCTVVGYPLGANTTHIKVAETIQAISDGADEIDVVVNIGWIKEKNFKYIEDEIKQIVEAAQERIVKVIIETSLLNRDEMSMVSKVIEKAGAHYIKTSTGIVGSGANVKDILVIKNSVSPHMKIKASGGITTYETADRMVRAGASRIGTSAKAFLKM